MPRRVGSPEKLARDPASIVHSFTFQHGENDCEVAQSFNLLHELAERLQVPALKIPYTNLAGAISPAANFPVEPGPARWLPKVQRMLPPGFRLQSLTDLTGSRWSKVLGAMENPGASFPIIGVAAEYWNLVTFRSKPYIGLDHDLILVHSDKTSSTLFDSYAAKLAARGCLKGRSGKGSIRADQALFTIPTSKVVTLWESAKTGKYLLWIEASGGPGTQLNLTSRDWAK